MLFKLPLELLLRVSQQLAFDDIFYFATCSRQAQSVAHQLMWHKYGIDLTKPRLNSYSHLVHSAVAFLHRHATTSSNIQTNSPTLQGVANRLAVEIYDRSPSRNWEPCLDYYLDKTFFILLDHVLRDPALDPLPEDIVPKPPKTEYCPTHMGRLMTNFLATLYPTLTAMFETNPVDAIHHRLLITHLNRHLDSLTQRLNSYHRNSFQIKLPISTARLRSLRILNQSLRRGFRVLVRFIGTLAQTDLLSPADLHVLTQQRILTFFLVHRPSSTTNECPWHQPIEEIEFKMTVMTDLIQAMSCRQSSRCDSGKELQRFISLLTESISSLVDPKTITLPSTPFI
ncbi:hypothetical protein F4703DRAFT_1902466 [Phycomyces blakesleeanus]